MGGSSSKSSVAPILPATALSASQIAEAVKALGEPYVPYAKNLEENGMDGAMLDAITAEDLPGLFADIGVTSKFHQKKLEIVFNSFKSGGSSSDEESKPAGGGGVLTPYARPSVIIKAFAGFLSHYKLECGTEARLVQQNLKSIIERNPIEGSSNDVFLDSDDLSDLRNLLQHVKQSKVLVLMQTKGVLTRPWVIIELHTAITHGVPIVALSVQNANPYNYAEAETFLMHFDEEIEIANPGASQLLIDMGIDLVDVAYLLSDCLPNIISTDLNPNASEKVLQASLEDLADSMRKAVPIAPSMSKEEWLEKRKSQKRSADSHARKEHGASVSAPEGAAANSGASQGLAEVPYTVPELPNGYIIREEDLGLLKEELLSKDGTSTALTSKDKKKLQQSKVGAHGMGGVGKTTMAAALMHDDNIRSSFSQIVWVSVGQEPDLRELQNSIYFQLARRNMDEALTQPNERFAALRDLAKGTNVLLVLDDVWDPKHEKPLNCIDFDTASKLLVTTRIRGLLKNAAEVDVGVLSAPEAFKLLLASAEVDDDDLEEGSEDRNIATEIVELCGRLPLTLAIAGGMVADNGQMFSEDILEVMKDKQELEDEEGMTVETRICISAEKMLIRGAGKNKDLILKTFHFLAIFPEDVAVNVAVFNKLTPLLSNDKSETKARLAVVSCLTTLLKYNLLKGALNTGVFMHDLVRDYVISQHSEQELRALQKAAVESFLAGRPEPDGFSTALVAAAATFEGYVARFLPWHIRNAMEDGEEPPDKWLGHKDDVIKEGCSFAVGFEKLKALSVTREASGALVSSAFASWGAFLVSTKSENDFEMAFRTCQLLERVDDKGVLDFELEAVKRCSYFENGTERVNKIMLRREHLLSADKFASFYVTSMVPLFRSQKEILTDEDLPKALDSLKEVCRIRVEAGALTDNYIIKMTLKGIHGIGIGTCIGACSWMEAWEPSEFGGSEEVMMEVIDAYDFSSWHTVLMKNLNMDHVLLGHNVPLLALSWMNLKAVQAFQAKALDAFAVIDYPNTDSYMAEFVALCYHMTLNFTIYLMLGDTTSSNAFMRTFGFTWGENGSQNINKWVNVLRSFGPAWQPPPLVTYLRLVAFLSGASDDGSPIDKAEVNAWIPSPREIAEMERGSALFRLFGTLSVLDAGARAYHVLGRDDDASELSKIAVSPEFHKETSHPKKTVLASCHSILGQVAVKRGNLDEADGHFAKGLQEATLSRLPMLQVLAARDWKKYLLEPHGRDCSAAEAAIDAACAKANKSREQLAPVL